MIRSLDRSLSISPPAVTYYHTLNSPAKSIDANKECTQCVVGGRQLLKIFNIGEKQFTEKVNLVGGHKKLSHSITDVQWNPNEENIVASSAGNGAVIIWDLNKECKKEHVFQQHDRFVQRLSFHPVDQYLLSCSADGNMHCFDIRIKDIKMTFLGDAIRDVQFHPTDRNLFCAVCESGNVQFWDIRRTDGCSYQFTAHIEPVFTLNWHPEERFWLATGGRDKSIKVWDYSQQYINYPTHNIQTIAPVHKIKWSPGFKYYIASCAFILDNNINIWDIRRPYVPFASFQEHNAAATGLVWQKDSDVIISCSEDKTIYHHAMEDAEKPIEKAPQVALSLAPNGVIGHAFPNSIAKPILQKNGLSSRLTNINPQSGKKSGKKVEFTNETSTFIFHDVKEWLDETWIEELAKSYQFYGKPFGELCDHNAAVASELKLADKAQTWLILKQLYSTESMIHHNSFNIPLPSPMSTTSRHFLTNDILLKKVESPDSFNEVEGIDSCCTDDEGGMSHTPYLLTFHPNNNAMALVGPELDAVFGDDDYNNQFHPLDMGADDEDLDCLPNEAFQIRRSFGDKVILPSEDINLEEQNEHVMKLPTFEVPRWDYENLVKDMLYHYAEQGDLQMCVTVLLALQDIGRKMIDINLQNEWYTGYLEILSHLHLFNIATEIINHAPDPVSQINTSSTTVYIQCDYCKKKIDSTHAGWYCKNCNKICQLCSICHIPVKGLYVWCQGCAHGGHLQHFKEWFENNVFCPTGCGHKCEFS